MRVPALSRRKPSPGAAAVHRADRRHGRRRPPAERRALVGGVRRRRAHRRRHRPPGRRGPPARAVPRPVGRARPRRPQGGGRRAGRAGRRRPSSPAPRSCATPSASRARRSAGGITVEGSGWATDLLEQGAGRSRPSRSPQPEGFVGELRSYQAEALGWLGFLDAVELGGCLALDMGLGKTPDRARPPRPAPPGDGPALVIAPPAVVGNWAAEAARFTPGLRVVVHHGAVAGRRPTSSRPRSPAPTSSSPPTAPPSATSRRWPSSTWDRVVLDEAQAIKNPANETAQQLRRIPARTRLALTGTPIENGLGDLWAILDFTNPGLVGTRPDVHRPARRARARPPCGPSTASSCSAAPRPSPRSPPSCPTASTSSTTAR